MDFFLLPTGKLFPKKMKVFVIFLLKKFAFSGKNSTFVPYLCSYD